jgi:hypothetical protein
MRSRLLRSITDLFLDSLCTLLSSSEASRVITVSIIPELAAAPVNSWSDNSGTAFIESPCSEQAGGRETAMASSDEAMKLIASMCFFKPKTGVKNQQDDANCKTVRKSSERRTWIRRTNLKFALPLS